MLISVVIPTLNAADYVRGIEAALSFQIEPIHELIVIDSESDDDTQAAFEAIGARVLSIGRDDFGHGRVRNLGAHASRSDILVYLTQDALPNHPEWLGNLVRPLVSGVSAASFSRQVPRPNATPLERYARDLNYPSESRIVTSDDIRRIGIRAFFFSNSCSAITRSAFSAVGGFPEDVIMNEDMLIASRLLRAGHSIAYAADSIVQHSHSYSVAQTFRRYFDIGVVFRQRRKDLAGVSPAGPGVSYVRGLLLALVREHEYAWIPAALAESAAKLLGVVAGQSYHRVPKAIVRRLSMHSSYWRHV